MSSAEVAQGYVRKLVAKEVKGWGDQENALSRLEQKIGVGYHTLDHIRTGRAKTVEAGLFARLRNAYIHYCEQQVKSLQHEIAIEKAIADDLALDDLENEMAALAAKIEARKARLM